MANKKRVINVEDSEPVEIDLDLAQAEFIILKARAFDVKVDPVEPDPGSNAIDDNERGVIEDYPSDPTETELRDAIEQLSEDASVDLIAMFWIGRGDFTASDWQEARVLAAERGQRVIASYLMGEPSLGDFLEEGSHNWVTGRRTLGQNEAARIAVRLGRNSVGKFGWPDADLTLRRGAVLF